MGSVSLHNICISLKSLMSVGVQKRMTKKNKILKQSWHADTHKCKLLITITDYSTITQTKANVRHVNTVTREIFWCYILYKGKKAAGERVAVHSIIQQPCLWSPALHSTHSFWTAIDWTKASLLYPNEFVLPWDEQRDFIRTRSCRLLTVWRAWSVDRILNYDSLWLLTASGGIWRLLTAFSMTWSHGSRQIDGVFVSLCFTNTLIGMIVKR